jgi:type I restriction enzyme S subunit
VKPLFRNLPDGCDMAYRNLFSATKGRGREAREQCEELWRNFRDLSDKNFVDRFPFEFHQRWFEMYLGTTLRDANFDVSAPKPGPDFCVTVDGRQLYIEAIAPEAGHPEHADHVPEPIYKEADGSPKVSQVPHTLITLRLAGAFHRKAGAYNRYRMKGYVPQDAICIIAINLRDIPHAWPDAQEFWIRALYGIGDRFVALDQDGSAAVEGRQHRELLQGSDGHSTEVASLLSGNHADISGVIGSSADAGNIRGPLGDDFVLMPRAAAKFQYPEGFIGRGIELKLRQAAQVGLWDVETIDHGGLEPQGPNTLTVEYNGEVHEVIWQVSGRELSVRAGGHGTTQLINRTTDPAAIANAVARVMLRYYDAEESCD